jgi:hypothetical protein
MLQLGPHCLERVPPQHSPSFLLMHVVTQHSRRLLATATGVDKPQMLKDLFGVTREDARHVPSHNALSRGNDRQPACRGEQPTILCRIPDPYRAVPAARSMAKPDFISPRRLQKPPPKIA